MRSKLYKFQEEDVERIGRIYKDRALIASSMGLGKTIMALSIIVRRTTRNIVVVCPAGLKEHWRRQAEEHVGVHAVVLGGMTPPPILLRGKSRKVYVVNYDVLRVPTSKHPGWVPLLRSLDPEMVILDELQYVKSRTSKRSRATAELCDGVPKVIGLSGTPAPNRPLELWFPLSIIAPDLFPSYFSFGIDFCNGHKGQFGWDFTGSSNEERLYRTLTGTQGCVVRRRKEDVLDQLPPKTTTVEPFELPKKSLAEYRRAVDDFVAWLTERDPNRAARALMAEELAKLGYLRRLVGELKVPLVCDWVADFLEGSDEKLLLFGVHRNTLERLYDRFSDVAVLVNGTVPKEKRQPLWDKFNDDKRCRLYLANHEAGGVGWSCRSSNNVAHFEFSYRPGDHEQANDRTRGIGRGTGRPVNVYYLTARDTCDEKHCELLQVKQKSIDTFMDGKPSGDMRLKELLKRSIVESSGLFKRKGLVRK